MSSDSNYSSEPNAQQPQLPPPKRRWARSLLILLMLGIGGGMGYGWYYINYKLPPTVANALTNLFSRPVEIGDVKSFSLTSVRFGESAIPPQKDAAEDMTVSAVEVNFNPLTLVTDRSLKFDVTLVNPDVALQQTQQGKWLTTEIDPQPAGFIEFELQSLSWEDVDFAVSARNPQGELQDPINIDIAKINTQFLEQRIPFKLNQVAVEGTSGHLNFEGESNLETGELDVALKAEQFALAELSRLVPSPVKILGGTLDSDANATFFLDEKDNQLPRFDGTAQFNQIQGKVNQITTPFQTDADLRLKEQKIFINNSTTTLGNLEGTAQGNIDLNSGYNLTGNLSATPIQQLLATLEIPEPEIPVSGTIQANVAVRGDLDEPEIDITAESVNTTIIDQVAFSRFQTQLSVVGNEVRINDFQAIPKAGGEITAQGSLNFTQQQNFALNWQINNVAGEILRPYQANLPSELGILNANGRVTGSLTNLKTLNGTGEANLAIAGGRVTISQFQLLGGQLQTQIDVNNIQPQQLVQVPSQLQNPVSGQFRLNANLAEISPETLEIVGEGNLNLPQGEFLATRLNLSNGQFDANFNLSQIPLSLLNPDVPEKWEESLSANFRVNGNLSGFNLNQIQAQGSGNITITAPQTSQIQLQNLRLRDGNWGGKLQVSNLRMARFFPQLPSELSSAIANTQLTAQGNVNNLTPEGITVNGSGEINNLIGGDVFVDAFGLENGEFTVNSRAANLKLGQVSQLPPEVSGAIANTQLTAQGNINNLTPEGITVNGSGEINNVIGGDVFVDAFGLEQGEFTVNSRAANLQLAQLSDELQGTTQGTVNVQGNLDNLTPSGITAQANLDFTQGISLITRSLNTRVRWDGKQIILEQASGEDFFAEGTVALDWNQQGVDLIDKVDLAIDAQNLDLGKLPLPLPEAMDPINVEGLADFSGTVTGNLVQPNIEGDLALQNFAVERFTFDSEMTGTVLANAEQGVNVDLSSQQRDRIQLSLLSPNANTFLPLKPKSFLIQQGNTLAKGVREDDQLQVNLEKLPLALLKDFAPLPKQVASQPASGELNGHLAINLANFDLSGELNLDNPSLGRFNSDRATAKFNYRDDTLDVSQFSLHQQDSEYQGQGRISFRETTPKFNADLEVKQGRIQDIFTALQVFQVGDLTNKFLTPEYGDASDLETTGVSVPSGSLEQQLRRFSEIKALLTQRRTQQQEKNPLPPLVEAQGNFTGKVTIKGTSFDLADIQAEWKMDGDSWQWGPYQANTVSAQGNLNNGVVTLNPIRLASGDRFINLSGTLGGQNQSAQLQVNNIPVAGVQNLVELPKGMGVTGSINGTATIGGNLDNPSARGEINVTNATLNDKPIDTVRGSFNYSNSELNFFAQSSLSPDSEDLTVSGDLPYQLPFASVSPTSKTLNIDISLQDEGFAFLDIISNGTLSWEGGEGEVNLAINGPFDPKNPQFDQLTTDGQISLSGATIGADMLPDPLSDLNAEVAFDFNQLQIEQFNASYGGGEVTAQGGLPLFNQQATSDTIDINLDNLAVKLPDLYQGNVNGNINIAGTSLEPQLDGNITVSRGDVILAGEETDSATATEQNNGSADTRARQEQEQTNGDNIAFNNLNITLGEDLHVTRPPIMDFQADGTLVLNGTLANMRPEGVITLQSGHLNLGVTQFRLAKDKEQTATFQPYQGLDPSLDITLQTSVFETTATSGLGRTGTETAETLDTSIGGTLKTIQVQAQVQGRASQIQSGTLTSNNRVVTLSSRPSRSETEIIALLGGGLTQGFQGDGAVGLANLAGTTFLGNLQRTIGNTLGLSEFRIFPTLIPTEKEGEITGSTLGLAAEAGIDITDKISFSVLSIFEAEQPLQYSLRYRLSDEILLRGSTNFSDNETLTIEFQTSF